MKSPPIPAPVKRTRRKKPGTRATTVRLSMEACERLDTLAARKGVATRNPLIQIAVNEYLDRENA